MYRRLNEIATDLVGWMIENADLRYIDIPCSCPEGTKTITINNPYYTKPKRKIYLYRYTFLECSTNLVHQTAWTEGEGVVNGRLLKTEEKIIEVEDE